MRSLFTEISTKCLRCARQCSRGWGHRLNKPSDVGPHGAHVLVGVTGSRRVHIQSNDKCQAENEARSEAGE